MPRLSITLTDQQNEALERLSATCGATKQSMIGLAVSDWLAQHDVPPTPKSYEGWYGWAHVTGRDPLSGEPDTYNVGYDGPFETEEEAKRYAEHAAKANTNRYEKAKPVWEYES